MKTLHEQIIDIDNQLQHCMKHIEPIVPCPVFGLLIHLQVLIMDLETAIQSIE